MTISSSVGKNCPYCQTPIKPGGQVMVCSACGMPHHADCWQENHGCTTFGCQGHPATAVGTAPQSPAPGTLACPTCGYLMGPMDVTCPRCAHLQHQAPAAPYPNAAMQQTMPPPPPTGYYAQAPPASSPPGYMPAELPLELRKWNWGAFFLTLFWAGAMNQWVWFALCFIPYVSVIPVFYLAIKGNELAWKSRRWQSLEQFQATQEVWKKWGLALFFVSVGLGLLIGIIAAIVASSSNS